MASRTQVTKKKRGNRKAKLQKNRSKASKKAIEKLRKQGHIVP